jgi:enoyl-CoA hydratase/carnithine racemase
MSFTCGNFSSNKRLQRLTEHLHSGMSLSMAQSPHLVQLSTSSSSSSANAAVYSSNECSGANNQRTDSKVNSSELNISVYENGCGWIELHRPSALNALTLSMVDDITATLRSWEHDDQIRFVVFSGAGPRAFCAGGDIRALIQREYEEYPFDFYRREYQLDYFISTYSKPIVSILQGIVMGGGVGISVHSAFRIVTDDTMFAMPETGIGLFPDVGGTQFLPTHCPGKIGHYMGLTGNRIKNVDVMYAGIGTHYIAKAKLEKLSTTLQTQIFQDNTEIGMLIDSFHSLPATTPPLADKHRVIDRAFAPDTVEGVIAELKVIAAEQPENEQWCTRTVRTLASKSPLSLKLTMKALQLNQTLSLRHAFEVEFWLACRITITGTDFPEGVRAQIIDKDKKPRWQPASLELVSQDIVDSYFGKFSVLEAIEEWQPLDRDADTV